MESHRFLSLSHRLIISSNIYESNRDAFARGRVRRTPEAFQGKALGTNQLKPRFDGVIPQVAQAHCENSILSTQHYPS